MFLTLKVIISNVMFGCSHDDCFDFIGMQLWVDLPKAHKMVDPSYQELNHKEYAVGAAS